MTVNSMYFYRDTLIRSLYSKFGLYAGKSLKTFVIHSLLIIDSYNIIFNGIYSILSMETIRFADIIKKALRIMNAFVGYKWDLTLMG